MAATHEARLGHMTHRTSLPRPMPGVNPCWHPGLGRTRVHSVLSRAANQQVAATNASNPSKSALARMPKDEVAEKASARGLDTEGNKQAIIDRLVAAYAEEQAQAEADSNSDDPVTYEDLMALSKVELQSQCAAVGLPKSKRTKEQLANSLLETMASGVASPQPGSNAEAGSSNGEVPDQASLEGDGVTGGLGGYDVQRPTAAAILEEISVDDAESVASAYQKLVDLHKVELLQGLLRVMPQVELSQGCSMLGLPRSHRTKAQMAESIVSHLQENASKPAETQDTSDPSGTHPLNTAQVPQSPPQPVERDANVKDVGIPTEGAGDQLMRQRQRLSPVREDLENLNAEEPMGELGLDLPELNPKSARSAVADEDMDTDVDVVAQQRRTDRQPADFADQEDDEVDDVRMDDVLMLDQEPNSEYDLDEEQRPRFSRNADGDLTEANFGNDDDTMGRLEDMGVAASGLVGDDVSRQNQGSAQRRRQASRVAAADIAEDEDDVYGSRATEARSPLASGSDEDDAEGEEGLASSEEEDLPMTAARGYGAEPFDGLQEPDGSEAFLNNAELADGFQTSASSADGAALDEEDVESMSDGAGMTNEQYGKARQQAKKASGDIKTDPGDSAPQLKAKRGKPKGKRATPVPDYVSLSTVSSSSSPFPLKDGNADSQLADPSGLEDHMEDHMEEVDRDAQLSPEADALIDAGVAAIAPGNELLAQDMPSTSTAAEDDTHSLTDAEVSTQSFAGAVEAADPDSDQNIMTDAQLEMSEAITDSDFELPNGGSMSPEGLVDDLAASEAVMTDALAAAQGSVGKAQVEEQPKATSPKASDAPTSSVPEPLAAHASGSTPIDTQQQSAQDLISDLAASEAVMQDGLATAELRSAAARVENNQGLKVDLQQQVQGMGDQLASLEASLQASDKQAGSLQQELASLGNARPDPPAMKVNGRVLNGASTHNLPQGYYYTLTDAPPAAEASQAAAAAAGGQGGTSAQPQPLASSPDGGTDTQTDPDPQGDRAHLASSSQPPSSSAEEEVKCVLRSQGWP
ncbi:hypothetical protein WJX82_007862 [Trebouxia sp. C0006]